MPWPPGQAHPASHSMKARLLARGRLPSLPVRRAHGQSRHCHDVTTPPVASYSRACCSFEPLQELHSWPGTQLARLRRHEGRAGGRTGAVMGGG